MGDYKGKDAFFVINMLSRPKSRGKIVLGGPDPSSYPLIHAGYLTHPDDIKVLIEGTSNKVPFDVYLYEEIILWVNYNPYFLGAKRTTDMVMNSTTFKEMDIRFPPTHFPGCEKHTFASDDYWDCFHRYAWYEPTFAMQTLHSG